MDGVRLSIRKPEGRGERREMEENYGFEREERLEGEEYKERDEREEMEKKEKREEACSNGQLREGRTSKGTPSELMNTL